jgi:hypothetical protein
MLRPTRKDKTPPATVGAGRTVQPPYQRKKKTSNQATNKVNINHKHIPHYIAMCRSSTTPIYRRARGRERNSRQVLDRPPSRSKRRVSFPYRQAAREAQVNPHPNSTLPLPPIEGICARSTEGIAYGMIEIGRT